jgi:hypothetical protein
MLGFKELKPLKKSIVKKSGAIYPQIIKQDAQGPGTADGFEEMERMLSDFFQKEICSVGISAFLVLHCIISQMLRSQPCDSDTASKQKPDISSTHKLRQKQDQT